MRNGWVEHGACRPTYSGKTCQPRPACRATQSGVRFGWLGQPRSPPPRYTPTARYGDDSQPSIAAELGAWHASKPYPVNTPGTVTAVPTASGRTVTRAGRAAAVNRA